MPHLSNERLLWVEGRIFTLGRMIRELTARQTRYQTNPRYVQYHSRVMDEMIAEQLMLNIERNVIEEYLEEQASAGKAEALK